MLAEQKRYGTWSGGISTSLQNICKISATYLYLTWFVTPAGMLYQADSRVQTAEEQWLFPGTALPRLALLGAGILEES